MPTVTYPLDTTGINASNLIPNELHVLTEVNNSTYRVLVPDFSPFYLDNFSITHTDTLGNITTLQPDVDYIFTLPYLAGSRSIGKMLYGALSISSNIIDGTLSITYQTLGGTWIADKNLVLTTIANINYNPVITTWDAVTNIQDTFPPINHSLAIDNLFGESQLIDAINQMRDAIISGPQLTPSLLQALTGTQVNEGISRAEMMFYSKCGFIK